MSFIRMSSEELVPICDDARKRCEEGAKLRTEKKVKELRDSKNWWRSWLRLKPLTTKEVLEQVKKSTDVFDHFRYITTPEDYEAYGIAERMLNACKHSKQVCVSISDLKALTG